MFNARVSRFVDDIDGKDGRMEMLGIRILRVRLVAEIMACQLDDVVLTRLSRV